MLKGYNSDVTIKGVDYHVQTEDWGQQNPFIVTRVFKQGAVLKTYKTPYSDVLPNSHYDKPTLEQALKLQHFRILDQIMRDPLG
jgi:hypothetical protein